jgi:hypothetical protein
LIKNRLFATISDVMSHELSSKSLALPVVELCAAAALMTASFGIDSKIERERALAADLGLNHPSHSVVMDRIKFEEAWRLFLAVCSIGFSGSAGFNLIRTRRSQ